MPKLEFHGTSPKMSRRMSQQKSAGTGPELALRRELHRLGLRYRLHIAPVPGLRRQADLVFPSQRVAVFVDGCFWHGCPNHGNCPKRHTDYWSRKIARNRARDRDTTARFEAAGWRVVRVWEHDDATQAAEMILRMVKTAGATQEQDSPTAGERSSRLPTS
jgi:DNA mismatch endonuclease, patch repair protein